MEALKFWQNKRVFLTGHTGFKGSWLSIWLHSLGADVTGFALLPNTNPSLFIGADVGARVNSVIGDIRDFDALRKALSESMAEIVIHLAAQPIVRDSFNDPAGTYQTNVMGTVNILEACRLSGHVKAVLIVTTDKCYENNEWVWGYREYEPMGGHDPYSSSKACCELIVSAYRRSFGLNVASARAGNVIGGGDWAKDRLLPDAIRAVDDKTPLEIRNPNAIRPWQHVLDCLNGYLLLTQALYERKLSEAFNFGPDDADAKSVSWVLERYAHYAETPLNLMIQAGEHPHEAQYLKLDISKAKNLLGWKPIWNAEKAIERTAQWNKGRESDQPWYDLCITQIKAFMQEAKSI